MTRALPYLYLALAIAFEVLGTSALKASETLTRLVPSLVTLIAYTASFVFLALSLRTIPIGIAYAIWAGLGIVLIPCERSGYFRYSLAYLDCRSYRLIGIILPRLPEAEINTNAIPLQLRNFLIVLGNDLSAGTQILCEESCVTLIAKQMS